MKPSASRFFFKPRSPSAPKGQRAYVVGDVHGQFHLLQDLLARIEFDVEQRSRARTTLVFLGDLIDRGAGSAEVVEFLRTYRPRFGKTVFLTGNHEEAMLQALDGDTDVLRAWLTFGGDECLRSYGLAPELVTRLPASDALALIRTRVPDAHLRFLRTFSDSVRFGDYLFVHAGIRPGLALEDQLQSDLRWIRDSFLDDDRDHGFVVVHGHTISEKVEVRHNRVGIDTGAFRTGVLTALGLEGSERWVLQTENSIHPVR